MGTITTIIILLTSKCLDIVERSNQSPLGCFPGASGQPIIGAK